jgi:hypothetical protein
MKYRQPGYRDRQDRDVRRAPAQPRESREGPRSPQMPGFHQVVRCAMCGVKLPPGFGEVTDLSQCPKCQADLHTCKNCVFFDPASRFECSRPIQLRVSRKDIRNTCESFEIRSTVEKQTTSSTPRPSLDPREAFERLFKK